MSDLGINICDVTCDASRNGGWLTEAVKQWSDCIVTNVRSRRYCVGA